MQSWGNLGISFTGATPKYETHQKIIDHDDRAKQISEEPEQIGQKHRQTQEVSMMSYFMTWQYQHWFL